jgi:ABC-type transport system involved in multi-copper enzyme maturation permease subunit
MTPCGWRGGSSAMLRAIHEWIGLSMLPVLLKELREQSLAKRTYVLRTVYALAMYTIFYLIYHAELGGLASGDVSVLGQGHKLFTQVVIWQFIGIYLFLPALVAPLIGSEDERGNLDLLLTTRLKTWELLAQMLFSRLIGMGTFLLLALPIAAVAFTLGGVSATRIGTAVIALLLTLLQVGCWSLWCSARSHSSMKALVGAYFGGVIVLFILVPLFAALPSLVLYRLGATMVPYPFLLFWLSNRSLGDIAFSGVMVVASAVVFFLFAMRALRRRQLWPSPTMREQMSVYRLSRLREIFARTPTVVHTARLEESPTSGFEKWRQRFGTRGGDGARRNELSPDLPAEQALSWRELRLLAVTKPEFRTAVGWTSALVVLTVLAIDIWDISMHGSLRPFGTRWLLDGILFTAMAAITCVSATLINRERAAGVLDLLLASPLSTHELITQKLAGARRLGEIACAVIAILGACEVRLSMGSRFMPALREIVFIVAAAWIYLRLCAWIGLAISLIVRNKLHAVVIALIVLCAWGFLPQIIVNYFVATASGPSQAWQYLRLLSFSEIVRVGSGSSLAWSAFATVNLLWYGMLLYLVRRWCLRHADEKIGRVS